MARPEEQRLRDVYQEAIAEALEFYDANPGLRVEPYGPGGRMCSVHELTDRERRKLAREEAERTMNRVMNTRRD